MKSLLLATFVLICGMAGGQTPHPYVSGSVSLMPAGYSSVAWGAGGGLTYDSKWAVFDSYAGYDTGRKDPAPGEKQSNGHDRYLRGFAGYRLGYVQNAMYLGLGARWSELSTTNYTKGGPIYAAGSWHPEVGLGYDFLQHDKFYPLFMRGQVAYMFRESKETVHYPDGTFCNGCGNGSQGVDISLWFPSPSKPHSHLFLRMNFLLFGFHDSITDPKNVYLTQIQAANKHFTMSYEANLGWRF